MKPQHHALPVPLTHLRIPDLHSQPTLSKTYSVLGTSNSLSSFSVTKSLIDKLLRYEGAFASRPKKTISLTCTKPGKPKETRIGKTKKAVRKSIEGRTSVQRSTPLHLVPDPSKELTSSRIVGLSSVQMPRGALSESVSVQVTPKVQVNHFSEFASHEQFDSQVLSLELQLTERLKRLHKTADLPISYQTQFPLYSQVFQDIIDRDKKFGCLLMKVKSFYENYLHSFMNTGRESASEKMLEQCSSQLKAARLKLQDNKEEKKLAHRKIEKLSKETMELGRRLDESEQECAQLKAKLAEISSMDLTHMSYDVHVWKHLVLENQSYSSLCSKFQKDLRAAKEQEQFLLTLVQRMKDRGFPVEELEQDLLPDVYQDDSDVEEMEPIVSGPAKVMEKPGNVPRLRLEEIRKEPEDDSRAFYQGHPITVQDHEKSMSFDQSGMDEFVRFFKDTESNARVEAVL